MAEGSGKRGAGGTPGGLLEFFVGAGLIALGGFLLLNQVSVTTNPWLIWGYNGFGIAFIPLLIGIAWLFFNGRAIGAWLLTSVGFLIIIVGIITSLDIYFRPTSLLNTLIMLGLLAAGLGLVARSLRAH
jgi:predicted membrane channel-forming protein YqfA (hemolysin III family)